MWSKDPIIPSYVSFEQTNINLANEPLYHMQSRTFSANWLATHPSMCFLFYSKIVTRVRYSTANLWSILLLVLVLSQYSCILFIYNMTTTSAFSNFSLLSKIDKAIIFALSNISNTIISLKSFQLWNVSVC